MTTTNRHWFILGSLYSIYYIIYYRFSNIQFIKPDTILSDHIFLINVREYLRGNQTWTIQRNWQHRVHQRKTAKTKTIQRNWQHRVHQRKTAKTKTQHNMYWTPLITNTNNVNTTWALLQTTEGKDEPNIVSL